MRIGAKLVPELAVTTGTGPHIPIKKTGIEMTTIAAIYGSPRRNGNTAKLADLAVEGARSAGADIHRIVLRDLDISPCLEIYGCQRTGRCVIQDDFNTTLDTILASQGIILASPIFFYTVSAHTKIFMDRCQSLWVKKYWVEKRPMGHWPTSRQGLFISAGATHGKRLFDGALLTVRYFMDVLEARLWRSLPFRGLDFADDVLEHPDYLQDAFNTGRQLVATCNHSNSQHF